MKKIFTLLALLVVMAISSSAALPPLRISVVTNQLSTAGRVTVDVLNSSGSEFSPSLSISENKTTDVGGVLSFVLMDGLWLTTSVTYNASHLIRITFDPDAVGEVNLPPVVLCIERMEVMYVKQSLFGDMIDAAEMDATDNYTFNSVTIGSGTETTTLDGTKGVEAFELVMKDHVVGSDALTETISLQSPNNIADGASYTLTYPGVAPADNEVLKWNSTANAYVWGALPTSSLPDQSGQNGKVLMTDGSTTSWQAVAGTGTVTSVATSGPITGGTITGSGTIGITQADTDTDGYLSSTDWNTFNNKQSTITINATPNGLSLSSGTLSLATASGSTTGALSSTDWTTFNNKLTLPSLTSGSVIFSNGTTLVQDNANLFWNDGNNRLGIGTATPATALDVKGTLTLTGATSGTAGILANATTTSYTLTLPAAQGSADTWLRNDGSGNLSWVNVTDATSLAANQTLSNLDSPTAVNVNLLPASAGISLGDATHPWNLITVTGIALTGRMKFSYAEYTGSATAVTIPDNVSVYCFNGTATATVTFPTVTSADNGIVLFVYNYSSKALNDCPDQGSTTRNLVSSKGGTWMVINGEWVCIGVS